MPLPRAHAKTWLERCSAILCSVAVVSCQPPLVVGELDLDCQGQAGARSLNQNGVFNDGPLPAPWKTSFEDGFCGYKSQAGFCYADDDSEYRVVTSPVHSGPFAAAFDFHPTDKAGARQVRCVREGVLVDEGYYGAWYYVPSKLRGSDSWNLFHFQGGPPGKQLHGLWDVSMDRRSGELAVYVENWLDDARYDAATPVPIPFDRWFQLEFYLKRSADPTGEVALFQDGVELLRQTDLITDDSPFAQWYVGNWAGSVTPTSTITLYVDDVSVRLP